MDLTIEQLLQAAEAIVNKTSKEEPSITWTYSKSTYECLQCKRLYHGELFHSSANPATKKFVSWCPKCIDEKLWWLHQNFTVEKVEGSSGLPTQAHSNSETV